MSVHALVFTSASAMLRSRSLRNLAWAVCTQKQQCVMVEKMLHIDTVATHQWHCLPGLSVKSLANAHTTNVWQQLHRRAACLTLAIMPL
jgi:hypothetical protein